MLSSCMTLVRSLYTVEKDNIEGFVKNHPAQESQKQMLINKIVSNLMISCAEGIQDEQVEAILPNIRANQGVDLTSDPSYMNLLNYDLDRFKPDDSQSPEEQSIV